jgi:hypothetical protein
MLSPDGFDSYNGTLSPKEYRAKYRENMDLAPKGKELQDPSKYANKERKEANLEKRYGFLIRDWENKIKKTSQIFSDILKSYLSRCPMSHSKEWRTEVWMFELSDKIFLGF